MVTMRQRLWLVALGCGLAGGCGDSDDGGSGVGTEKLLSDLTGEDNVKLCQYYERRTKSYLGTEEQFCTEEALRATTDTASCEARKQSCQSSNDYEHALAEDWGCDHQGLIALPVDGACHATVGDVEECLREEVKRETSIGKKYTCSRAGEDLKKEEIRGRDCENVFYNCPGAYF